MTAYETGIHTFKQCSSHSRQDREKVPSQDELNTVKTGFVSSSKIGAITSGEAAAYLTMIDKATPNSSPPCQEESPVTSKNPTSSRHTIISDHDDSYTSSKRQKRQGKFSWQSSVCSNPPLFMSRYASHSGLGNNHTIELPALSESEKKGPLGANLCFVMAMFFSLNERILEQRRKRVCQYSNTEIMQTIPIASRQYHGGEGSTAIDMPVGHPVSRTGSISSVAGDQIQNEEAKQQFQSREHNHEKKEENHIAGSSDSMTAKSIWNLSSNCEHFQPVTQLPALNNTAASAPACSSPQPGSYTLLHHTSSSSHQSNLSSSDIKYDLTTIPHEDDMTPSKNNTSIAVSELFPTAATSIASKEENTAITNICEDDGCLDQYQIHGFGRSRSHSLSISLHSLDFVLPPEDSSSSESSMGSDEMRAIESSSIFFKNDI